jgi:hypothetical protein
MSPPAIRAARTSALCVLLIHILNPPDVIVIPEPTQQFFHGPPTLRVPSVDIRLLEVTTRKGWESEPVAVTYETLRTDPLAWAGMFFRDWDRVPPRTLRDEALVRMTVRYRRVVDAPRVWCTMGPRDWDEVPQPIRAMAFMNMVARWEACLDVARRMGLAEDVLVARLRAVAMAESWFEHRALSENANGSSDLGLAQATTATRRILRTRAAQGTTDLRFDDEEYLDPLKGSRVLVYWFGLMLDETGQDLDRATRAYHVGSGSAWRGQGTEYLEGVQRLEERFMGPASPSPAWRLLRARTVDAARLLSADRTSACSIDGSR